MTIGTGVPDNALWDAIKFVGRMFGQQLLGEAEERAILRIRKAAFGRIAELARAGSDEDRHQVAVMERLLGTQAVASCLVGAALARSTAPIRQVAVLAQENFVTKQIKLARKSFDKLVGLYYDALVAALDEEARKPSSPLFNLVALASIDVLLTGVRPTDSGNPESVRRFMSHYIGDGDHRVPFCGRDDELARLDAWLADKKEHRPFFVTGPAGRGKSALLVRWLVAQTRRQVTEQPAIVFVPISLRFQTHTAEAVYGLLATQIGGIYQEALPRSSSPTDLLNFAHRLLRSPPPDGRSVLIVFDGLDEATGWTAGSMLMPHAPGSHVRLVASARPLAGDRDATAWLRRLDWIDKATTLTLQGLSTPDIVALLDDEPAMQLDATLKTRLASILVDKTSGDPLLVDLWTEELRAKGPLTPLTLERIRAAEPDLSGVFDLWWDNQRSAWGADRVLMEQASNSLLHLLAVVKGPISTGDLRGILPTVFDNALLLSEAARSLGRFVSGDGATIGYSFCHPRIGAYFVEEVLDAGDVATRRAQVVDYCVNAFARWKSEADEGARLSPYVVRYLGAHLSDSEGHRTLLYDLVSADWQRAWMQTLGETLGFLDDVWRAADVAKANGAVAIHVKAGFVVASFRSQGENLSSTLIVRAQREGVVSLATALAYTEVLREGLDRITPMLQLAANAPVDQQQAIVERAYTMALDSRDLRSLGAFVESAPPHFKPVAIANFLDLVERYQSFYALGPVVLLATSVSLPPENRKALCDCAARLAKQVIDANPADANWAYPAIAALDLSGRKRLIKLALRHCPWQLARNYEGGLVNVDCWTIGTEAPNETPSIYKPSGGYATAIHELYQHCPIESRANVRDAYLAILESMSLDGRAYAIGMATELDIGTDTIRSLVDDVRRASVSLPAERRLPILQSLLPACTETERDASVDEIFSVAASVEDGSTYIRFYAGMGALPYTCSPEKYIEGLLCDARREIEIGELSVNLTHIAGYLPQPRRSEVLKEAWDAAFRIGEQSWVAPCLSALDAMAISNIKAIPSRLPASAFEFEPHALLAACRAVALGLKSKESIADFGSVARVAKLLEFEAWLKVFLPVGGAEVTDIIHWAEQAALDDPRKYPLLQLAKRIDYDERLHDRLAQSLDTSRGLERLQIIGYLMRGGAPRKKWVREFERARKAARSISPDETRISRLTRLAGFLPAGDLRDGLVEDARKIANDVARHSRHSIRAGHTASLLEVVPEPQRASLLRTFLELAEHSSENIGRALESAVRYASAEQLPIFSKFIWPHIFDHREALAGLVARAHALSYWQSSALPSMLNDLIDRISACNRSDAAQAILTMSPLLVWVHGHNAMPGIRDEIAYCLKHWP
jgi:hypothetical protein